MAGMKFSYVVSDPTREQRSAAEDCAAISERKQTSQITMKVIVRGFGGRYRSVVVHLATEDRSMSGIRRFLLGVPIRVIILLNHFRVV
jgi:hypothetical protein